MKRIDDQHHEYTEHYPDWEMCEDAAKGERAIHNGGTKYLPRLSDESDDDYKKRVANTPFFNATKQTLTALHGMMFDKPAAFEKPAGFDEYADDIDLDGTTFDELVEKAGAQLLEAGKVCFLVDHPPGVPGETKAEAEARGIRPKTTLYEAESLINWRYARVNNRRQLVRAVLCEEGDDGEQYRELLLESGGYVQRLWKIDKATGKQEQIGADIVPLMNGKPLQYLPLVVAGNGHPPLIDLVTMNIHHYQRQADYEQGCHLSGLPTGFISGYAPAKGEKNIYVGGSVFNALPRPEAKAYYAEVTSKFEALRTNLQDKQAQMAVLGARMLETQRPGVEAAETAAIHRKGEEAQLGKLARELSQAATRAVMIFCDWAGLNGTVAYALSTDYATLGLTAQELTAVVSSWQVGAVSGQAKFEYLQRRNFYPDTLTYDEEQARIGEAGVGAPPVE